MIHQCTLTSFCTASPVQHLSSLGLGFPAAKLVCAWHAESGYNGVPPSTSPHAPQSTNQGREHQFQTKPRSFGQPILCPIPATNVHNSYPRTISFQTGPGGKEFSTASCQIEPIAFLSAIPPLHSISMTQ
jgi:hypothetical protein